MYHTWHVYGGCLHLGVCYTWVQQQTRVQDRLPCLWRSNDHIPVRLCPDPVDQPRHDYLQPRLLQLCFSVGSHCDIYKVLVSVFCAFPDAGAVENVC